MKRILNSLTNFFKDKAKTNFWLYVNQMKLKNISKALTTYKPNNNRSQVIKTESK